MRFVQRNLWPCLVLLLTGCSLVVDFPEPRSLDGGTHDGGFVDCDLKTHEPCPKDEYCCEVNDDRKRTCLPRDSKNCLGCNDRCDDPRAPQCGSDGCECVAGSGEACAEGEKCSVSGSKAASCVTCDSDMDCVGQGTNTQCVNHACEACDRVNESDPADDTGCPTATPVCNTDLQCVGCKDEKDCPPGQICNPGRGCSGCSPSKPIGENGCVSDTRPVCKPDGDVFTCAGCIANSECNNGYCDEMTGACNNECDPGAPALMNGCDVPTKAFCKQNTSGEYECHGCTANTDCSGAQPYCLMEPASTLNGACVACRSNTDCASTPTTPTCGTNKVCRAAMSPADCGPGLVPSGGKCVQCTTNTNCTSLTATPYCNAATNTCVACGALPDPAGSATACSAINPATPICAASGRCVQCTTNTECVVPTGVTSTPICAATTTNTCIPCTMATPTPDAACMALNPATSKCVTGGSMPTLIGSCGRCNPVDPNPCPSGQACTAGSSGYDCALGGPSGGPTLPDAGVRPVR